MPKVPFVPGSDTSEAAAENLKTRLRVGFKWIDLAAGPDGANVREVERALEKLDSGPSARQGELVQAGVLTKHESIRRERCGVYFLTPDMTVEQARAQYQRWVEAENVKKAERKAQQPRVPANVAQGCLNVAAAIRGGDATAIGQALANLLETIRVDMA